MRGRLLVHQEVKQKRAHTFTYILYVKACVPALVCVFLLKITSRDA